MIEVPPLNTVTPIMTAPSGAVQPEEAALVAALVQERPARLAVLARPVQLNGIVTFLRADGAFTLQTAAGNLTLSLLPLPNGARHPLADQLPALAQNQKPLGVVLQPGAPPTQALLLLPQSLAGQWVLAGAGAPRAHGGHVSPAHPASAGAAPVSGETPAGLAPLKPGATFTAIVLPSTPGAGTASHAAAPPAGTAVPVPETPGAKPVFSPLPPALQAVKPGSETAFRLLAVLPSLEEGGAPPNLAPDALVATVAGKGPGGGVVLEAAGKAFFARGSGTFEPGTRLALVFLPAPEEGSFTLPLAPDSRVEALQKVLALLHQTDPVLARNVVQARVPQANAELSGTLLFLLNALQQGGARAWLGEAGKRLQEKGHISALDDLDAEWLRAGGLARDPVVGEWRSFPLPFLDRGQMEMLHLYVHQDRSRGEEGGGPRRSPAHTRFLINLSMTRLGALQLDGLSQARQLDLVLRSEKPLPESLPPALRETWRGTLEALGLAGSLIFQTGREHWVSVHPATPPAPQLVT